MVRRYGSGSLLNRGYPLIGQDKQRVLLRKARAGNQYARNNFLLSAMPAFIHAANQYKGRLSTEERDDLIDYCVLKAMEKIG